MSTVIHKTVVSVAEAWGIIERAEPGDSLSVGVALDYVMDGLGCSREAAKTTLYRHVAKVLTESISHQEAHVHNGNPAISPATTVSLALFSDDVDYAKKFMSGYASTAKTEWSKRAKRLVKLCSWVEGTP